jgi:hypothetical protein
MRTTVVLEQDLADKLKEYARRRRTSLNVALHANDADFARFPGLRWRNPL